MKSHFYHTQLNVNTKNIEFDRDLMKFLGWKVIHEGEDVVGFKSHTNGDIWFYDDSKKKKAVDYDQLGMNHLAIRVEKQSDIDKIVIFLKTKKIKTLYGTPKHRPEFVGKKTETYYQIMFESPDNMQFEIL